MAGAVNLTAEPRSSAAMLITGSDVQNKAQFACEINYFGIRYSTLNVRERIGTVAIQAGGSSANSHSSGPKHFLHHDHML